MIRRDGSDPLERGSREHYDDAAYYDHTYARRAEDVFALDESMRQFLREDIAREVSTKGAKQALFDALYSEGRLKLDYDSELTRTASEGFSAKAGNCLTLAILIPESLRKHFGNQAVYNVKAVICRVESFEGEQAHRIGARFLGEAK